MGGPARVGAVGPQDEGMAEITDDCKSAMVSVNGPDARNAEIPEGGKSSEWTRLPAGMLVSRPPPAPACQGGGVIRE
jgi:hypothetical protein